MFIMHKAVEEIAAIMHFDISGFTFGLSELFKEIEYCDY